MVKRKHAGGGAPKASVAKRLKNNESKVVLVKTNHHEKILISVTALPEQFKGGNRFEQS